MSDGMDVGAVAMFDALGFKGIWKRNRVDGVINKLNSLSLTAASLPMEMVGGPMPRPDSLFGPIRVALVSDTVVIAVTAKPFEQQAQRTQAAIGRAEDVPSWCLAGAAFARARCPARRRRPTAVLLGPRRPARTCDFDLGGS